MPASRGAQLLQLALELAGVRVGLEQRRGVGGRAPAGGAQLLLEAGELLPRREHLALELDALLLAQPAPPPRGGKLRLELRDAHRCGRAERRLDVQRHRELVADRELVDRRRGRHGQRERQAPAVRRRRVAAIGQWRDAPLGVRGAHDEVHGRASGAGTAAAQAQQEVAVAGVHAHWMCSMLPPSIPADPLRLPDAT